MQSKKVHFECSDHHFEIIFILMVSCTFFIWTPVTSILWLFRAKCDRGHSRKIPAFAQGDDFLRAFAKRTSTHQSKWMGFRKNTHPSICRSLKCSHSHAISPSAHIHRPISSFSSMANIEIRQIASIKSFKYQTIGRAPHNSNRSSLCVLL